MSLRSIFLKLTTNLSNKNVSIEPPVERISNENGWLDEESHDLRYFTHTNFIRGPALQCRQLHQTDTGITDVPAPFDCLISVASDCDYSEFSLIQNYQQVLTKESWLDFRDSRFISHGNPSHGNSLKFQNSPSARYVGHPSILSSQIAGYSHTEFLTDYFLATIDHLHGPCSDSCVIYEYSNRVWKQLDDGMFCLEKVGIDSEVQNSLLKSEARGFGYAVVVNLDTPPEKFNLEIDGLNYTCHLKETHRVVAFYSIDPVVLLFEDSTIVCDLDIVSSETNLSFMSECLEDVLSFYENIASEWALTFNTITAHGGQLFYNEKSLDYHTKNPVNETNDIVRHKASFYGVPLNADAEFGPNAIDLNRFKDLGIYFVNPCGNTAAPDKVFESTRQIVPSKSRQGTGLYVMYRTGFRSVAHSSIPDEFRIFGATDSYFRRTQFKGQFCEVFGALKKNQVASIYTHLGNSEEIPNQDRIANLLSYAAHEEMATAVANIEAQNDEHVGILPTSIMNQYLWMRNNATAICKKVEKSNNLKFHSYYDKTLQRNIALTPALLYGQSFAYKGQIPAIYCDEDEVRTIGVKKDKDRFVRVLEGIRLFSLQNYLPHSNPSQTVKKVIIADSSNILLDFASVTYNRIDLDDLTQFGVPNYLLLKVEKPADIENYRFSLIVSDVGRAKQKLNLLNNEFFFQTNSVDVGEIWVPVYLLVGKLFSRNRVKHLKFTLEVESMNENRTSELVLADICIGKAVIGEPPKFAIVFGEIDTGMAACTLEIYFKNGKREACTVSTNNRFILKSPMRGLATIEIKDVNEASIFSKEIFIGDFNYLGSHYWKL